MTLRERLHVHGAGHAPTVLDPHAWLTRYVERTYGDPAGWPDELFVRHPRIAPTNRAANESAQRWRRDMEADGWRLAMQQQPHDEGGLRWRLVRDR